MNESAAREYKRQEQIKQILWEKIQELRRDISKKKSFFNKQTKIKRYEIMTTDSLKGLKK